MVLALGASPDPSAAGSYVTSIQPDATQTNDSYLREDGVTELNGPKSELRLKASSDNKNRNIVVSIPLTGLGNKTVLQAWLKLTESAANSPIAMESRVYPLTESWTEPDVCWRDRTRVLTLPVAWSTPGGTHATTWTDREFVSDLGVGTEVSWQVGPILQAWNLGTLANHGLLIEPPHGSPDREVVFRSSETGTATQRPRLVVHYTDEAPAVRSGTAETQPRVLPTGSSNARLTVWLDVDASGATPTGAATGFDQITLAHSGAFVVTALESFEVDGVPVASPVSFTDNGSSVTIKCSRIHSRCKVRVNLRVTVLSGATPNGVDLPITLDDTATPGAWAQALWPGNADGIAGNGDDWILYITAVTPQRIHVVPDTARVVQRLCTSFAVEAQDALGNTFTIEADSFRVLPPTAGTITRDGTFCAIASGAVPVVGCWGGFRDTALALVAPAQTPQISAIQLLTRSGAPTNLVSPGDTMFVDVSLSDGDGFGDVRRIDFDLAFAGHETSVGSPAYRAAFRWTRGTVPSWTLADPVGTSWQLVPSLCSIDSVTNTTAPQTVRCAFVVGVIARYSNAGDWTARVHVTSATPPDTSEAVRAGIDSRARVVVSTRETDGAFSSGQPGALHLPLARPTDGRFELYVMSNAPWDLSAAVTDLAGVLLPGDTLFVGEPNPRIAWALNPAGTGGGYLDLAYRTLAAGQPAATVENASTLPIYLWIDHPASASPQSYTGSLALDVQASGAPASVSTLPITATVVSGGQAAQSGIAEVTPHTAPAGAPGAAFDVYLMPNFQGTDTGINRILIDLPDRYGSPTVTSAEVAGSPVGFETRSDSGSVEIALDARLAVPALLHLRLLADAPTALDSIGSSFVVLFDDTTTALLPQAAVEGNANGVSDGNSWMVAVVPGPLAAVSIVPDPLTTYVGIVVPFTADARDAYDHPVQPTLQWLVEGGIGTISPSGAFTATGVGTGRVIARSGTIADTAIVTVWRERAIAIRSVRGPVTVYQGQPAATIALRIENLGGVPVLLDSLKLSFSRGQAGDADADFLVTPAGSSADTLPVGVSVDLTRSVAVNANALTGPLSVSAWVSGLERDAGGLRLTDANADTALVLDVRPGGVELLAQQLGTSVRPGQKLAPMLALRLRNLDPEPHQLARLTLANQSVGPGPPETLDAELGDISLFVDDGDGIPEPDADTLLLTTTALDGRVHLVPLGLTLPAGSERRLVVACSPPLQARDGDALDAAVLGIDDLEFERELGARNAWPVDPWGAASIDGMVADQIASPPVGPSAISPGARDVPVFRFRVPPNGYESDVLRRLAAVNLGTARPGSDVLALRAWSSGPQAFDATSDRPLGTLSFTGDRWELSGLTEPVPSDGLWVVITTDLSSLAEERRTIQLALPAGSDPGIGVSSGDSGPLDRPLAASQTQTVSDVDRVTLTAMPLESGTARPGDRQRLLMHVVATNSYASDRTLTALTITDVATGSGSVDERDREVQQLVLRADGNGNGVLDDPTVDPVLATGFFQSGRAAWSGLTLGLSPFSARHLWITGDLSLRDAVDGDQIGSVVLSSSDVGFAEPTTVTALWPLDSGVRWTIDGLVAAQVSATPVPTVTLGPSEGPAPALDWTVPPNGYRADVLRGVFVTNLGNAASADLAKLELWKDGGDGVFSGGGDDVSLGVMVPQSGGWQSPLLSEVVVPPGVRLFVAATVSATPAESVTVRLAIPVDGIQFDSGNDGPIDASIENPDGLLVSGAPLLVTLELPAASTLGQEIVVRMRVRNVGSERVDGVTPSPLEITGPAAFSLVDGPVPSSLVLDPGATDTLTWRYRAAAVGETRFVGSATGTGASSGLIRRSPAVASALHRVFAAASRLDLDAVQTMPVSVNPGATGIVPFSLTLTNPGGPGVSDVWLRGLRVRLETEAGAPVIPADLVARVAVHEGTNEYLARTSLETQGNAVDLTLATPVRITSREPATLSLLLDLTGTTVVRTFRVVIPDTAYFVAEDATSQAPVTVALVSGGYPLRSNVARVVAPATDLDVAAGPADTLRVAVGAAGIPLMRATLVNRGVATVTADARVAGLRVQVRDGSDAPVPAGTRLRSMRVTQAGRVLASANVDPASGPDVDLNLSPPLNLPADAPVDVALEGDLAGNATIGWFRLAWVDSTQVNAYDANSRASLAVHLVPAPLLGGPRRMEGAADTLVVASTTEMPASVVVGQTGVATLGIRFRHPDAPGVAPIRIDSLVVAVRDEQRRPLAASVYLDRVRVLRDRVPIAEVSALPVSSTFGVPLGGLALEPGDTARVDLVMDVQATAPAGTLELAVSGGSIYAMDADAQRGVAAVAEPGSELPMLSGVGRIVSPSRELVVGFTSRMPAVLVADGAWLPAAELTLTNQDPDGVSDIIVDRLRVRACDQDRVPRVVGGAAIEVGAAVNGVPWATSGASSPDSATVSLIAAEPLVIPHGTTARIELHWRARAGAAGRIRLGLDRADVGVIQPSSAVLAVQVLPQNGQSFPMWSDAGGMGSTDLVSSYSNFPNPFAAGRQSTTFAYYLRGDARVSLRIMTPRGESVVRLLEAAPRALGSYQSDAWDGRNGRGNVVLDGVYVAELIVRYNDGTEARCLRKVAVVR